ncbi:hypothetical protein QMN58_26780, partial [Escherichia coli]|nr:hypothetical protein [Escherichia coli]
MKIKRAPNPLQLAITLVVHCGTNLGHVSRAFDGGCQFSHNTGATLADSKVPNYIRDQINLNSAAVS